MAHDMWNSDPPLPRAGGTKGGTMRSMLLQRCRARAGAAALVAFAFAGCETSPSAPTPAERLLASTAGGLPTEPAYVDGRTVTITALEAPRASALPGRAEADLYLVAYPTNPTTIAGPITPFTTGAGLGDPSYWQSLGITSLPQCDPCNHEGTPQTDADDFHDHVLDSAPTTVGFSPLWHVFLVFPAYNGVLAHDQTVSAAYATRLPAKSESAVDALLADKLADGSPIAVEFDTGGFFLCAVVNANAANH